MHQDINAGYDSVTHLLSRVGLLALSEGMDGDAQQIFACQRGLLSDATAIDVAQALVLLELGRSHDAIRVLREEILSEDASHAAANIVCGLALRSAGLPGARECFETVLAASIDPFLRGIALKALAEIS